MKKRGNPRKPKKRALKSPRKVVTMHYGKIPKSRHFCILCFLIDGVKNRKKLTVHHHIPKSKDGKNNLENLEVLCERHHTNIHHPYLYRREKIIYSEYRKKKYKAKIYKV